MFKQQGYGTYAARHLQHVGDELCRNGRSGLVLLVLSAVGKAGNDSRNAASRCSAAGMDHDEHLHEAVVDVAGCGRLEYEDVLITDRLSNGDAGLSV
jgi:hypothetical protein